jgi:hypothetical protein
MFNTHLSRRAAVALIGLLATALPAAAATPVLTRILPRGGQRGTEVEATFIGQRLADVQEILIYEPGVTVAKINKPADDKEKAAAATAAKVTFKIAPDARLGEYQMRLRTATGITELRSFWVGPFPTVAEKEPNSDFKAPQPIDMNVTVAGVVDTEDQDFFVIEAKKGQRITAEVEGMRLGEAPFDPYLAILDENRFELASSDDSALHRQDGVVQILAPKDGKYIIQIRDSAFAGSSASFYRLHVGNFPRPRIVYPLGGQAGQSVKVTFLGDVAGPIVQTVKLPDRSDDHFGLVCVQDGLTAPSENPFHVSAFPAVDEVEPNNTYKAATKYDGPLPIAFNGIIDTPANASAADAADPKNPQDNDLFKFTAKKGQVVEVNVFARRLRSPLDPVMTIQAEKGGQLATNDDTGGPDSYVRFNPPADGEYAIRVRDHLKAEGELYAYRVEITPVKPAITVTIPLYTNNYSQERNSVTVPKGNRYATLMRIQRQDAPGGPLDFTVPGLPAGVKAEAANIEPGVDTIPVLFEAAPDAKVGGALVEVNAKPIPDPAAKAPAADATPIASTFKQTIELVTNGNNAPYYTSDVNRLAVGVADEAPFTLKIIEPKVPLVQGGEMKLKVVAERKKDFTGPINVRMLWKPPGVEAIAAVEIPSGKTECDYLINASDGAAAKKWKLVVVATADENGTVWAASPFTTVEVAPPFVTAKFANANVEQGQNVTMTADLDVKTKWQGKAKAELLGLPGSSTTVEKELSAEDTKLAFPVTTAKTTPAAKHNGLLLRVTIMQNGEPIVHNIARGGVLRVDAPLVAKDSKTPATKPAAKPAAAAAATPKAAAKEKDPTPKK